MLRTSKIVTVFVLALVGGITATKENQFPDGFMFGASSEAYKVEGA